MNYHVENQFQLAESSNNEKIREKLGWINLQRKISEWISAIQDIQDLTFIQFRM